MNNNNNFSNQAKQNNYNKISIIFQHQENNYSKKLFNL